MNKKFVLLIFICAGLMQANAQAPKIDTMAVSILDHMSVVIGELKSCSVMVKTNYDINSKTLGLVKHSDDQQLYMHGPNKLLVKSEGDKGTRYFSYNGKTLTHYSLDKNQYSQVAAPATIIDMIDSINKIYGIEFPVADFFYPTFVDDILAEAKNLAFLGITKVGDKDCFHIAGTAKDKTFQFWISDDAFYLPMKMVIINTAKENSPQYEATLSNWQVNPDLPDAIFEFTPPLKAKKIKMIPLSQKK